MPARQHIVTIRERIKVVAVQKKTLREFQIPPISAVFVNKKRLSGSV